MKKIAGSLITILVILALVLIGPINFEDPAKTLTQTNAYGYGTSHHHHSSGGGSSGGSPYVQFIGLTPNATSSANVTNSTNSTNITVVPIIPNTPVVLPVANPSPANINVPPVIEPPAPVIVVGENKGFFGFFKTAWAWFVNLF